MLIKPALRILGLKEGDARKSGKREAAIIVSLITLALLLFSWPSFGEGARKDLLFYLLTFSFASLAGAFGLDAWFKQSHGHQQAPEPDEPPPLDDDEPKPPEGFAQ